MKTIQQLNEQIRKLKMMKKEIHQAEFDDVMQKGLEKFKHDISFRRHDVRLLGSSYFQNGMSSYTDNVNKAEFERYCSMCVDLQHAIDNLETFYSLEKHIPILQDMIDNQESMSNSKNLFRIFKRALKVEK